MNTEKADKNNTNIIFLDIDGVLCSARCHVGSTHDKKGTIWDDWDSVVVGLIKQLCNHHNAQIVFISTWVKLKPNRIHEKVIQHSLEYYCHKNYLCPIRVDDNNMMDKYAMVEYWLKHNDHNKFVIFEDDDICNHIVVDELKHFDPIKPNLVLTDPLNGMLIEHYTKAKNILTEGG